MSKSSDGSAIADDALGLTAGGRAWRRFGTVLSIGVYVFLLMPSLIVIPMSFGGKDEMLFPPSTFSLNLYREFFFGSNWMATTIQSLRVAVASTAIALACGVCAAYALVRYEFPGKRLFSMFLLSPVLVPAVIVALGTYLYFSAIGITGTTSALIIAHALHTTPFVIVTATAGLRHVDVNLERAAEIMGAGRIRVLRSVTLPLMWPAIMAGAMFSFLISFDEVVLSWFISNVSTQTLPVKMYSSIQWEVSPVISTVSVLLTAFSLIICLLTAIIQRK